VSGHIYYTHDNKEKLSNMNSSKEFLFFFYSSAQHQQQQNHKTNIKITGLVSQRR
jgi:cytochrome c-type biogenesis protein CcmE